MAKTFILTCEHAGNDIPTTYEHLFRGKEEVLYSHKAIDFGALRLARYLARETGLPLYYTTISRLLVEANRSLESDSLFSEYSKKLPAAEKQRLLDTFYHPHRNEVEQNIATAIAAGNQVVHLALHTFTPVLEGNVREVEIGILYDPFRALEETVAQQFKSELNHLNPKRKVLFNEPYTGTADGFATYLRTKFTPEQYAGFELEINQKFYLHGEAEVWEQVVMEITQAVQGLKQA